MMGYIPVGIAFSLFGIGSNIPAWALILMSIFIYAGSGQFLLISLLVAKVGALEVFIVILLLNLRHCFYTMALLEEFRELKYKTYAIFALTDESFALLRSKNYSKENLNLAFNLTVFLNQIYWIIGTILGITIGKNLHINYEGIDFSLTALFAVLSYELFKQNRNFKVLFLSIFVCAAGLLIFPSNYFLVGSLIVGTIILLGLKRWMA